MSIKSIIGENRSERFRNLMLAFVIANLCYSLFPFPPIFWRILSVLSATYCIYMGTFGKLERSILLFIGMNLLYMAFACTYTNPRTTTIGNTLSAFATLFIFSYFNKKRLVTDKFIITASIGLTLGCLVYYTHYQAVLIESLANGDDMQVNASSVFLFLIPLLFYVKNKWIALVEFGICIFFIVSAVKRGNIVAAVIPVILFVRYRLTEFRSNKKMGVIFIFAVIGGGFYLREYLLNNDFFLYRMEETMEGNTSNRDRIYWDALSAWSNSSGINSIIGNGYDATLKLIRVHAHCDWLEILVDYGVMGVMIYISLFLSTFLSYRRSTELVDRYVIISCLCIWGIKSLISMAYIESWMMIMMLTLGIAVTGSKNIKKNV